MLTLNDLINVYEIKLKDIEILTFGTRGYDALGDRSIVNLGDGECIIFNYDCRIYFDAPLISDEMLFCFEVSDRADVINTDGGKFVIMVSQRVLFEMIDGQIC